jgi:hypothetical protein
MKTFCSSIGFCQLNCNSVAGEKPRVAAKACEQSQSVFMKAMLNRQSVFWVAMFAI